MDVKKLTRYADILGSGRTSTVYSFEDKAIKFLEFDDAASAITELVIADRIKNHRVISILDFDYNEFNITLTMKKYIGNLAEVYPRVDIYKVTRQLIEGVMTIHRAGFIHCDIKPDNLLIDAEGNLVITDFGIALPIDEEYHRSSVQTVTYRAPEVDTSTFSCKFGPKIDMWSVGCIIYMLLTGKPYIDWEGSYRCDDSIKLIGAVYGLSTHPRKVIKRILRDSNRDEIKNNLIKNIGFSLYESQTELVELMVDCLMPKPKRRIDSISAYFRIMSICKMSTIPRYKLLPYVSRTPMDMGDLEIIDGVDENIKTIFKIEALNFANNMYLHMSKYVESQNLKYAALYMTACIYSVQIFEENSKFIKLLGSHGISVDDLGLVCLEYLKLARAANS